MQPFFYSIICATYCIVYTRHMPKCTLRYVSQKFARIIQLVNIGPKQGKARPRHIRYVELSACIEFELHIEGDGTRGGDTTK